MKRNWLKNIRKKLNMSHKEVAEISGISRNYYTEIENGNKNPSVKHAKRIALALGFYWGNFFENEICETRHEQEVK